MREDSHQIWMCDQDTNPCLKDRGLKCSDLLLDHHVGIEHAPLILRKDTGTAYGLLVYQVFSLTQMLTMLTSTAVICIRIRMNP